MTTNLYYILRGVHRFGFALLVLLLLTAGVEGEASCRKPKGQETLTSSADLDISKSWDNGSKRFTYEAALSIPEKPNGNLTILLHGNGGNGPGMLRGFKTLLPDDMLVAPTGYQNAWNIIEEHDAPDVGFLGELVDKVAMFQNVNSVRLLGVSNGGGLTLRAAIELDQNIITSLVAIVSSLNTEAYHDGSFWGGYSGYQKRQRPKKGRAIQLVQNTNDPLIPYDGGVGRIPGTTFLPALESAYVLAASQGFSGKELAYDAGKQSSKYPNVWIYKYGSSNVQHVRSDARHGMNDGIRAQVAAFLGY